MSNVGTAIALGLSAWPLLSPKTYHDAQEKVHRFTRNIDLDDVDVSRPVYINGLFLSGGSKEEVIAALHEYDDGTYGPVACYGRTFASAYLSFDVVNRDVIRYDTDGNSEELLSVNPSMSDVAVSESLKLFQLKKNGSNASIRSSKKYEGFVNHYYVGPKQTLSNQPIKRSGTFSYLGTASGGGSIALPNFDKDRTYHVVSLASNEVLVVRGQHSAYEHLISSVPPAGLGTNQGDSFNDATRISEHFQTGIMPNYVFNNLYYYSYDQLAPFDRTSGGGSLGSVGYRHICLLASGGDSFYTVLSKPNLLYSKEIS